MVARRDFLKFMGVAGIIGTTGSCASNQFSNSKIRSISPSRVDDVVLAKGLAYEKLISWGDQLTNNNKKFGFNNDFISMHNLDDDNAIMWVNHESVNPLFVSGYAGSKGRDKSKKQIDIEKANVGGSVFKISRSNKYKKWQVVVNHTINNRLDSHSKIQFSPEQKIFGSYSAIGTLANCAGGKTSWGTFLTCEENFDDMYGQTAYLKEQRMFKSSLSKSSSWEADKPMPPEHYGWVVEYNPVSKEAKKLVSLGRFSHEGATAIDTPDGRTVVYMADDAANQFVYKFISQSKGSLSKGGLYVADTKNGRWLKLTYENSILKSKFKNQQEILIRARDAAKILGATPLDRPEDIEINPITGDIFIALTNNKKNGNYHGSILKISEDNKSYLSLKFKSEIFLLGGSETGFSCPDNMVFDRKGNLWLTTDISGLSMNKPPYEKFKNNGLFYIPSSGNNAGKVFQMASAPIDAEFTGPCFSEDYKTLFLSVQHPGEKSKSLSQLSSTWNSTKESPIPRPAVIMISGPILDSIVL